ncbi:MAG TPA: subclass B1 metallo-beta-lactamase [Bacteroidales bacterium]|nr:subclass B1 metallo-beta-lactamase [Bacteroidales bacterium]
MRKIRFFLYCFISISVSVLGQSNYKSIKLSPDIELVKISENAYMHVSYAFMPGFGRVGSNGLIFINEKEALLFDTPGNDSLTQVLTSWICDTMQFRLVGFVPNHWHDDCMGGLKYLQSIGIKTYANQMTINIAKQKNLPVPEIGFTDSLELRLGKKLVKCYYFGAAHSADNIVVWVPSEQILFAGCMAKAISSQNLGNTADGDVNAYPATIKKVYNKFGSAKVVIPGHGSLGGLELLTHTIDLAKNIKK